MRKREKEFSRKVITCEQMKIFKCQYLNTDTAGRFLYERPLRPMQRTRTCTVYILRLLSFSSFLFRLFSLLVNFSFPTSFCYFYLPFCTFSIHFFYFFSFCGKNFSPSFRVLFSDRKMLSNGIISLDDYLKKKKKE